MVAGRGEAAAVGIALGTSVHVPLGPRIGKVTTRPNEQGRVRVDWWEPATRTTCWGYFAAASLRVLRGP